MMASPDVLRSQRHWWLPALCAACALLPSSLPAQSEAGGTGIQFEHMPAAEKQRLTRNFERFSRMSAAEQVSIRKLHADLIEDGRQGGHLQETLRRYEKWLSTLDIAQREELRRTTDPHAREALVRRIMAQQKQQQNSREFSSGRGRRSDFGWGPWGPRLSTKDLDAVMAVIEKDLRETSMISAEQEMKLKGLTGYNRNRFILEIFAESGAKFPPDRPRLTRQFREDVLAAISDEKIRTSFDEKRPLRSNGEQPRVSTSGDLIGMIARGMLEQMRDEAEKRGETGDALKKFMLELDPARQTEIANMESTKQWNTLQTIYLLRIREQFIRAGIRPPVRPPEGDRQELRIDRASPPPKQPEPSPDPAN